MNPPQPPRFDHPDTALRALAESLTLVPIEASQPPISGRVLASPVIADRDSPAADVSAMDGYAVRLADLKGDQALPVQGESTPGSPPPQARAGAVVRIFTGAIVPNGYDAVVKREDTEEERHSIRLRIHTDLVEPGMHIRRAGENARAGSSVLSPGISVTPAARAAMANFGCERIDLFAPVRVSLVTTGDEVGDFSERTPQPWQLRNSNRASVSSLLESIPWIRVVHVDHCPDDRDALANRLRTYLIQSDAILLTGGVSMGDYDHVPEVIQELGGEIVFHGIPMRPGKPILGAATKTGQLLMGLPGNPVSSLVGCRRMALPLLAKMAGLASWMPIPTWVRLRNPDSRQIPLHWMRLVQLVDSGLAELVDSLGSGDLVSLGHSSGFVELPPNTCGEGPWPYLSWT